MITDEDIEHWRTRLLDVYPDGRVLSWDIRGIA